MEKDYLFLNKGGTICLNLGLNRLATITWGLKLDKIKFFKNVTKLKLNDLPLYQTVKCINFHSTKFSHKYSLSNK